MKKILSIFAASLCAVALSAEPVVLPATLDVNNVSFRSEGMPDFVIEEGQDYAGTYFDMGAHDSSNDTTLYAEWDVTIEPIQYNLAVDVYNTNSWSVRLHLLNQNNEEVKTLFYKGHSGDKGHFAIGSLDLRDLEAGDYKLRAHCSYAWSALKLKDVILEANYAGVPVALPGTLLPAYAELSANASVTDGAIAFKPGTAPDEYANWNVSFAAAGTYNVTIDITASNGHLYGVELIAEDEETLIGAVSEGAAAWDTGIKELGAIEVPEAGNYIVHLTNATQWSEAVLNSITFAGEAAPVQPKTIYFNSGAWASEAGRFAVYCITGESWVDLAIESNEENLYKAEIPATTVQVVFCRMNPETTENIWGNLWNQTEDLTIPEGKDLYTITGWGSGYGAKATGAWSKYGEEPAEPLENGFYLVGKFGGVDAWGYESLSAEKQFTWHAHIGEGNEEWIVVADLVEGDKVKACYVYNGAITEYFPAGEGNEYVVDANHAGAGKTIYFQQKENQEWGGHFFIEPNDDPSAINNVEATQKAVKAIENGQLVIIKNGVRYNAQGAVVK